MTFPLFLYHVAQHRWLPSFLLFVFPICIITSLQILSLLPAICVMDYFSLISAHCNLLVSSPSLFNLRIISIYSSSPVLFLSTCQSPQVLPLRIWLFSGFVTVCLSPLVLSLYLPLFLGVISTYRPLFPFVISIYLSISHPSVSAACSVIAIIEDIPWVLYRSSLIPRLFSALHSGPFHPAVSCPFTSESYVFPRFLKIIS